MTVPVPLPWERQPGETAKSFAAFLEYLAQPSGGRNADLLAKTGGKRGSDGGRYNRKSIDQWRSENRWVERARAHDAHLEKLGQAERDRLAVENGAIWIRRDQEDRERHYVIASRVETILVNMLVPDQANPREMPKLATHELKAAIATLADAMKLKRDIIERAIPPPSPSSPVVAASADPDTTIAKPARDAGLAAKAWEAMHGAMKRSGARKMDPPE